MDIHRVRFVEYNPQPIHCLRFYEESSSCIKLAVSRGDGSIEIWLSSDGESFFKDVWVPGRADFSIEALVWCEGRLFSAGLTGIKHRTWSMCMLAVLDLNECAPRIMRMPARSRDHPGVGSGAFEAVFLSGCSWRGRLVHGG